MIPLSAGAAARAAALLRGEIDVPVARDAATVVLLRDGESGIEVFLLRRVRTMAFAPGMYVFPGGVVEPRDFHHDIGWVGPPPATLAEALACDEDTARALACAAVRETFEECGVLLATPAGDDGVVDASGDDWEVERLALVHADTSLADVLRRRGLRLRSDLLRPWAHWVTPEFEPRRFDTRFFVCPLPPTRPPRTIPEECDEARWLDVHAAVGRCDAGDLAMLLPTVTTLRELSAYDVVADVLAASHRVVARMPRPVLRNGQVALAVE